MEVAIGVASGLIGSVLNQLSDEFVQAYVDSAELGLNSTKIKQDLMFTQGLLHEAQRGVSDNPGLQGLLQELSAKADEAEDALDELHYFIIQDQLDGTQYAVPDLGDGLPGHARHGLHAFRHTIGNYLTCFSRSPMMQDRDDGATNPESGGNDGPIDKLTFDRVAMSKKIKSVIEEIHSLCDLVSVLLKIVPHHSSNTAIATLKRPLIGSTTTQYTLYGRSELLEKTMKDITSSGTYHLNTLSVLPIVGSGGIGKTTFTQHLYNDKRIQEHFPKRIWVCVSNDFDVLKINQQILSCIEGNKTTKQTTSLDKLQLSITDKLKSTRFLIVFNDIWECNREGWENLLAPFLKAGAKGNMVIVTTRFPLISDIVKTTTPIALKGLEPDEFFTFFEALIFDGKKPQHYQDDFIDLAKNIAKKLKGSPLAAKTIGRLLKKDLSQEHWLGVLENNEWQKQKNDDDIMPSLRISYDYLPFHLKKCFPYFALFPEDYKFKNLEITYFWIAVGTIDKDENYMEELTDNGFLVKEGDGMNQYFVLHDLLHDLSLNVSSQECLNIGSSLKFRADDIPKSIRYMSITMEDTYRENFRGEMVKLKSKVDIVNLKVLMIFREYGETIDDILRDTFKEIESIRVLFVVVMSPHSSPYSFSKLIHLRYLKITRSEVSSEMTLPGTLSRLYHLKLLDLRDWHGSDKLPKDISCLINLCHFWAGNGLHCNVREVGKMKFLRELKKFCIKNESDGFELSELGNLTELGGKLGIYNLENVATKEEAMKANLMSKGDLKELRLVWGGTEHYLGESSVLDGTTQASDVLDGLEPPPNLQALVIKNHGGSAGPSWFCDDIRIAFLKSLQLEGVSWTNVPPFGQLLHLTSLRLIRVSGFDQIGPDFGGVTDRSFMQLKVIVLEALQEFTKWVGVPGAHSFSRLEYIHCTKCPNLCALPFLQECSTVSYDSLSEVEITDCPKLLLPPMPHTSTLYDVRVFAPAGTMIYAKHGLYLTGSSSALAWHNMADKVETIGFGAGSKIPWGQLSKLTSLKKLEIEKEPSSLSMAPLSKMTSLTSLMIVDCDKIKVDGFSPLTAVCLKELWVYNKGGDHPCSVAMDLLSELGVAIKKRQGKLFSPAAVGSFQLEELHMDSISAVLATPICSLLSSTLNKLVLLYDHRVHAFTEEEEEALQLLTFLQTLYFENCQGLPSLPRRLHSLPSLRELKVCKCPEIRSLPKEGIPSSLQHLWITDGCSEELKEQAKQLKGTNPGLRVQVYA